MKLFAALLFAAISCPAFGQTNTLLVSNVFEHTMDRFEALSMLESGDNDFAVGPRGEVSRYQIMPSVWRTMTKQHCYIIFKDGSEKAFRDFSPTNSMDAVQAAMEIQAMREYHFEKNNGRFVPVTDSEFALLWHCPDRIYNPTKSDLDYAQRFCNLVNSK
jgi:hypothetical protein